MSKRRAGSPKSPASQSWCWPHSSPDLFSFPSSIPSSPNASANPHLHHPTHLHLMPHHQPPMPVHDTLSDGSDYGSPSPSSVRAAASPPQAVDGLQLTSAAVVPPSEGIVVSSAALSSDSMNCSDLRLSRSMSIGHCRLIEQGGKVSAPHQARGNVYPVSEDRVDEVGMKDRRRCSVVLHDYLKEGSWVEFSTVVEERSDDTMERGSKQEYVIDCNKEDEDVTLDMDKHRALQSNKSTGGMLATYSSHVVTLTEDLSKSGTLGHTVATDRSSLSRGAMSHAMVTRTWQASKRASRVEHHDGSLVKKIRGHGAGGKSKGHPSSELPLQITSNEDGRYQDDKGESVIHRAGNTAGYVVKQRKVPDKGSCKKTYAPRKLKKHNTMMNNSAAPQTKKEIEDYSRRRHVLEKGLQKRAVNKEDRSVRDARYRCKIRTKLAELKSIFDFDPASDPLACLDSSPVQGIDWAHLSDGERRKEEWLVGNSRTGNNGIGGIIGMNGTNSVVKNDIIRIIGINGDSWGGNIDSSKMIGITSNSSVGNIDSSKMIGITGNSGVGNNDSSSKMIGITGNSSVGNIDSSKMIGITGNSSVGNNDSSSKMIGITGNSSVGNSDSIGIIRINSSDNSGTNASSSSSSSQEQQSVSVPGTPVNPHNKIRSKRRYNKSTAVKKRDLVKWKGVGEAANNELPAAMIRSETGDWRPASSRKCFSLDQVPSGKLTMQGQPWAVHSPKQYGCSMGTVLNPYSMVNPNLVLDIGQLYGSNEAHPNGSIKQEEYSLLPSKRPRGRGRRGQSLKRGISRPGSSPSDVSSPFWSASPLDTLWGCGPCHTITKFCATDSQGDSDCSFSRDNSGVFGSNVGGNDGGNGGGNDGGNGGGNGGGNDGGNNGGTDGGNGGGNDGGNDRGNVGYWSDDRGCNEELQENSSGLESSGGGGGAAVPLQGELRESILVNAHKYILEEEEKWHTLMNASGPGSGWPSSAAAPPSVQTMRAAFSGLLDQYDQRGRTLFDTCSQDWEAAVKAAARRFAHQVKEALTTDSARAKTSLRELRWPESHPQTQNFETLTQYSPTQKSPSVRIVASDQGVGEEEGVGMVVSQSNFRREVICKNICTPSVHEDSKSETNHFWTTAVKPVAPLNRAPLRLIVIPKCGSVLPPLEQSACTLQRADGCPTTQSRAKIKRGADTLKTSKTSPILQFTSKECIALEPETDGPVAIGTVSACSDTPERVTGENSVVPVSGAYNPSTVLPQLSARMLNLRRGPNDGGPVSCSNGSVVVLRRSSEAAHGSNRGRADATITSQHRGCLLERAALVSLRHRRYRTLSAGRQSVALDDNFVDNTLSTSTSCASTDTTLHPAAAAKPVPCVPREPVPVMMLGRLSEQTTAPDGGQQRSRGAVLPQKNSMRKTNSSFVKRNLRFFDSKSSSESVLKIARSVSLTHADAPTNRLDTTTMLTVVNPCLGTEPIKVEYQHPQPAVMKPLRDGNLQPQPDSMKPLKIGNLQLQPTAMKVLKNGNVQSQPVAMKSLKVDYPQRAATKPQKVEYLQLQPATIKPLVAGNLKSNQKTSNGVNLSAPAVNEGSPLVLRAPFGTLPNRDLTEESLPNGILNDTVGNILTNSLCMNVSGQSESGSFYYTLTKSQGLESPTDPRVGLETTDPRGGLVSLTDPRVGLETTDPRGGLVSLTDPRGGLVSLTDPRVGLETTDPRGGLESLTDPRVGLETTDPRGGLVSLTDPRVGLETTDPRGGLVSLTDPRGGLETTDPRGGLVSLTDPRVGLETTDPRGGLVSLTDPRGGLETTDPRSGLESLADSRGDLESLTELQGDLESLTELQGGLESLTELQGDLESLTELQGGHESLTELQGGLESLTELQGDLESLTELQGGHESPTELQGGLESLTELQGALESFADPQINLEYYPDNRDQKEPVNLNTFATVVKSIPHSIIEDFVGPQHLSSDASSLAIDHVDSLPDLGYQYQFIDSLLGGALNSSRTQLDTSQTGLATPVTNNSVSHETPVCLERLHNLDECNNYSGLSYLVMPAFTQFNEPRELSANNRQSPNVEDFTSHGARQTTAVDPDLIEQIMDQSETWSHAVVSRNIDSNLCAKRHATDTHSLSLVNASKTNNDAEKNSCELLLEDAYCQSRTPFAVSTNQSSDRALIRPSTLSSDYDKLPKVTAVAPTQSGTEATMSVSDGKATLSDVNFDENAIFLDQIRSLGSSTSPYESPCVSVSSFSPSDPPFTVVCRTTPESSHISKVITLYGTNTSDVSNQEVKHTDITEQSASGSNRCLRAVHSEVTSFDAVRPSVPPQSAGLSALPIFSAVRPILPHSSTVRPTPSFSDELSATQPTSSVARPTLPMISAVRPAQPPFSAVATPRKRRPKILPPGTPKCARSLVKQFRNIVGEPSRDYNKQSASLQSAWDNLPLRQLDDYF